MTTNGKLLNGLAVFASGYVKRYMEVHYDTLMQTSAARKLMEQDAPTRYGIEAALNALFAFVDQLWAKDTPLGLLVREVAMDAPAEVSKRLINGFREHVINTHQASESRVKARTVEQALLELDDETLSKLLVWVARASPQDRDRLRQAVASVTSGEQPEKLAQLDGGQFEIGRHISSDTSQKSTLFADLARVTRRLRHLIESPKKRRRNS